MATPSNSLLFTIFTLNFFLGFHVYAVPYDYSYTLGCTPKPEATQYNGGIVVNPEFNDGLKGWTAVGSAKIEKNANGNKYAVVSPSGISQTFDLDKEKIYTVSAWVQVSKGKAKVEARLQTANGVNRTANWIMAQSGCWKMIKGGFNVDAAGRADLRFEVHSNVTGVDILVDNVSVQPFTRQEWISHQDDSREKARKTKVKLLAVDGKGHPIANATVSVTQKQPSFPIGAAINQIILRSPKYQKWFLHRFKYTVFQNELKWSETEKTQGVEKYTVADAMLDFCKSNNLTVRGHDILWGHAKYQPEWVLKLPPEQLRAAALRRVNSVVSRYEGEFVHWDVVNENMNWNLFSKLDSGNFDASIFNLTHQLDQFPILFLNDYNVVEESSVDGAASPSNYLDKIEEIRSKGYNGPLGIGLESHFDVVAPNIAYVRASIDMLASTGLPIWITEFDVNFKNIPNPIENLEMLLREFHSRAAIGGIIFWSAMSANGTCWAMCLTNKDYTNNPAGDVVDKFMSDFIKGRDFNGTTDSNGVFEASLFHGEYEANVTLANGIQNSVFQTFKVVPVNGGDVATVQLNTTL